MRVRLLWQPERAAFVFRHALAAPLDEMNDDRRIARVNEQPDDARGEGRVVQEQLPAALRHTIRLILADGDPGDLRVRGTDRRLHPTPQNRGKARRPLWGSSGFGVRGIALNLEPRTPNRE